MEKDQNSVKKSVRPQNKFLTPWKAGIDSPNPSGRPKGLLNYATIRENAIRRLAKENGKTEAQIEEEIMANALLEARKGNFQFYKDDKDRMFGKAPETIKHEVEGGLEISSAQLILIANKLNEQDREDNTRTSKLGNGIETDTVGEEIQAQDGEGSTS